MKLMMVSLGCDKNLVDTEMMLGCLADAGYSFTDDETEAEVIVVNTCCFIGDAKEESINTLIELGRLKQEGNLKCLIAAGCLAQRYHDEMSQLMPEVDAIIGTMAFDKIAKAIENVLSGGAKNQYIEDTGRCVRYGRRIVSTGGHFAYLKIAEGCNKHCTYCVIPSVRGDYRSFPMEELVDEARKLAEGGVKELILVAQETTLYGTDLYGIKALPELIGRLSGIDGIFWIRLLYCYPEEITEEIADMFVSCPKLLPYIDMPIQHASDRILKRMGRKTDRSQLYEKIKLLRSKREDICIRTTLIVGFPGETEDDVNELADFVSEVRFDRLGVFTYSREEGTPAADFPDQTDEKEKERRRGYLMELQQQIAFEKAKEMKGRILTVMIEGKVDGEDIYAARSVMDAPGIDGMVFLETESSLMTGDFVRIRVTGSYEYDLIGVPEEEFGI